MLTLCATTCYFKFKKKTSFKILLRVDFSSFVDIFRDMLRFVQYILSFFKAFLACDLYRCIYKKFKGFCYILY